MNAKDTPCIEAEGIGKAYRIWKDPSARLKYPLLRAVGRSLPPALCPARWSPAKEGKENPYFHDFFALRNLSFAIRPGEIVGIMGRNGSGKSTLLQILAGTLRPSSGRFRVSGKVAALLELGSGFNPDFTGRENALLNAAILGLTREEAEAKLDEILEFADIGEFIDQPAKTYSSGMMVRLAFAVQTTIEPAILIVDEALSVGDEAFQRKCFARIERLRERGTTILLVSHSSAQVIELCDRAFLLHRGELVLDEEPVTVAKQYHRLIYSPPEDQEAILGRIRAGDFSDRGSGAEAGAAAGTSPDAETAPPESGDESFFDPGLVSQSRVSYPSSGLVLSEPMVRNAKGERVNVLTPGCEYRFSYAVEVRRDCFQVVFGTLLRTTSGVVVSGFRSHAGNQGCDHLPAATRLRVEFRFRSDLAEGLYFLNVGAEGSTGADRGFLHRIVDAFCVRVLAPADRRHAGLASLFGGVEWSGEKGG
jgi:lipopolysaccharide transport system ATP-binding protein